MPLTVRLSLRITDGTDMTAPLRIGTWNVRGASYDKIAPHVLDLDCDVLVLQECGFVDSLQSTPLGETTHRWRGRDRRLGLAVFTFGNYDIADGPDQEWVEPDAEIDMEKMLPWVLPVEVAGPASFNLMGVWADNSSAFRPATAAIRKYAEWLSSGSSVVAGDFNNHRKWDRQGYNERDHKVTMDALAKLGLVSTYHRARRIGESRVPPESDMTFWEAFNKEKGHHIDFIYAPAPWILERPSDVEVGDWASYVQPRVSDHAPVIAYLSPDARPASVQ